MQKKSKFCTTPNKIKVEKKSILLWFSTNYIIHYKGFQMNYNALSFCEKSILSPILWSELNMGIDYIDITSDQKNHL